METIYKDQNYVEVHSRMLWDKQSAELKNFENEKKKFTGLLTVYKIRKSTACSNLYKML